ncbi:Hypothetical protein DHA2_151318 [Giardia duodenalis]|uniref:Uncharacterized protein n=1 Tax=Giardia intestinalis TaxID=5741 RepID=V6TM00_GIAIN|nr:Hypothetical protein DHA2_151318 [Giardia intestinalis]
MSFFGSSFEQTLAPVSQAKTACLPTHMTASSADMPYTAHVLFSLLRDETHAQLTRVQNTIETSCNAVKDQLIQVILGENSFRQEQFSELIGATNSIATGLERFTQQLRDISAQIKGVEGQIQTLMAELEAVEGRLDESLRGKIDSARIEITACISSLSNSMKAEGEKVRQKGQVVDGDTGAKANEGAHLNAISYQGFAQHLSNMGTQITMTQPFIPAPDLSTRSNSDLI